MEARSNLRFAIVSAFIIGLTLSSGFASFAQNNRPRYSSRQHQDNSWSIPEDTVISVRMNGALSSRNSHVGDKFTATVEIPVYVNGKAVIPAGSIVEGRVTQVTAAKRMGRSGAIAIDFDDLIFPNGTRVGLNGTLTSDDPETRGRIDDESRVSGGDGKRTGVFVGGGGAVGAVLGGIAGGAKGAIVGGVIGAGVGIAGILLSKGEEAQVPSGTPFGVQLRQPIIVRDEYINGTRAGNYHPADQGPDQIDNSQPPNDQPADPVRTQPADTRPENTRLPDNTRPDDTRPSEPMPDSAEPEPEPESRAEVAVPSGPPLPLTSPEMIRRAQVALKEQGYYEGEPDGAMSQRTSNSLKVFQHENKLPESGELDQETARRLGILATSNRGDMGSGGPVNRPVRSNDRTEDKDFDSRTVMANVLSATANRAVDGAIYVLLNTQANTGGWRWYGEHVINGDTLEVYARAVRPTGMVTQALTRGKIELKIIDGVEYVRRVVIHSASADQVISLGSRGNPNSGPSSSGASNSGTSNSGTSSFAASLQRQADELLSEYQRISGVRSNGSGVQIDNSSQYKGPEVELFFALDSFANAAHLYARLIPSLQDQESLHDATLSLAQQARRTDRVVSTSSSRAASALAGKWDVIRQDVLRLMRTYSITSAELDN